MQREQVGLFILRVSLGLFLLLWSLDKLVVPEDTMKIFTKRFTTDLFTTKKRKRGLVLCIPHDNVVLGANDGHSLSRAAVGGRPCREDEMAGSLLNGTEERRRNFMLRRTVLMLIVLVACTGLSPAQGDEVDGLRASFEHEIAAFNARDLDTLMGNQHEHVVALNPASPTPVDGKSARRQSYQTLFATTESVTVTPKNPQFRVIDNTGLVWGEYTIAAKSKDKPMTTTAVRFTRTYVKSGGQWLLVLYHVAPLSAQPQ